MEFLLYTLTVGSFLMVFPYLSQGGSITMKMPSYTSLNSELKVTCEFTADSQLLIMELHHGNSITAAIYKIDNSSFTIDSQSQQTLEIGPGTTIKGGSLTFIFKSVTCSDFTWYMCKGKDLNTPMESSNKTLQVNPHLDFIRTTTQHIVNEVSTFTCEGTVRKEGVYSVKWYRRILSVRGQLSDATDKVTSNNQCSRRILSTLTYNVSESDVPNLILWCRIESGQTVDKSANFSVQEITTIAATISPQPVKAGLDPGSIVGIVLGIIAIIVLVVLLVWFLVIRPKRLKPDGPSKDKGPEPNAKDYQVQENVLYATVDPLKKKEDQKGEVNPAMEDKNDADNAPYTVYPPSEYHNAGGHSNPAMDEDLPNHMSGSQV